MSTEIHTRLYFGGKPNMLDGYVKYNNESETPMEGVEVTLKDSDGNVVAVTTTNSDGYYMFIVQNTGNYQVEITDSGSYSHPENMTSDDAMAITNYGLSPYSIETVLFLAMDSVNDFIVAGGDAGKLLQAISASDYTLLDSYPFVYFFENNLVNTATISNPFPMTVNINTVVTKNILFMWAGDSRKSYNVPKICKIYGKIEYYNTVKTKLIGIEVSLYTVKNINELDTKVASVLTDVDGNYEFLNILEGKYIIKIDNYGEYTYGGITSSDATMISDWGLSPTEIEMVMFLAADVFLDGAIDGFDSSQILYAISEEDFTILDNYPYVFYKSGETINDSPYSPISYLVTFVNEDINFDIYFLWAGDFDGSWTPS